MKSRTKLALLLGVIIATVAAVASWSADRPVRMSGGGGFPLTASVTSMWGAVDELVVPGQKPLTFIIYFRGDDGWHNRKWESKQQWNSKPFFIEFSCDLVTLRAEVDPTTHMLSVFGHSIDLAKVNVVLVEHVDRPGEEIITSLGRVNLVSPEESNPAAWVLENNEAIRSRVIGTGK
ncbi:MAG: hypothetical protein JF614_18310 [Acidobacteria bacterium]|nr:hypothetical protein [Acidobacteriota bacterium]